MSRTACPTGSPTFAAAEGRRGKSARCPFCGHVHPLDAVKAKGFAGQYEDAPLVAADLATVDGSRRTVEPDASSARSFALPKADELAATTVDLDDLPLWAAAGCSQTNRSLPATQTRPRLAVTGSQTWAELDERAGRCSFSSRQSEQSAPATHELLRRGLSRSTQLRSRHMRRPISFDGLRESTRGAHFEPRERRPAPAEPEPGRSTYSRTRAASRSHSTGSRLARELARDLAVSDRDDPDTAGNAHLKGLPSTARARADSAEHRQQPSRTGTARSTQS